MNANPLYPLGQWGRVAFFAGLHMRLLARTDRTGARQTSNTDRIKVWRGLMADISDLLARDRKSVAQGAYGPGEEWFVTPPRVSRAVRALFADLPQAQDRRRRKARREVAAQVNRDDYPDYYLHNFHYQTDGYLSGDSAALYDVQVETLFTGTADLMRRQALVPVAEALAGQDQRDCHLIDLGCGTGRFLYQVKSNWPRLAVTGVDLSQAYLEKAARHLRHWKGSAWRQGMAEQTGLADGGADLVTSIFLFHELPEKVRIAVLAEAFRLLKPGGRFVLVDSVQTGDRDGRYDRLLSFFPEAFNEPYYASYLTCDLRKLAQQAGFECETESPAYLSKVLVFEKP